MQDIQDIPVLILAYNRYEKFLKCFQTLYSYGCRNIYISLDGTKNNYDLNQQEKIIKFYLNQKLSGLGKINRLKENNGCRLGPIKGISWFFEKNEYGVILEDDLIISKNCLKAFYKLLNLYKESNKYMSISSFYEYSNEDKEYLYSMPIWRSWGWATWSDKWFKHIQITKEIKKLGLFELYKFLPIQLRSFETIKILKSCQLDLIDAWDYEFNFSHIYLNYKSLTLGGINNYVYGFDETATHTLDINSIGIDFQLFKERDFDFSIIKDFDLRSLKLVLKKCGFFYKNKYKKTNIIFVLIYSYLYMIILNLRIFKRHLKKLFLFRKT